MAQTGLSYSFSCPNCSGNFSIEIDKIPPVQARFRCPGCKQPMDFPSRDEARVYATLAQSAPPPAAGRSSARTAVAALDEAPAAAGPAEGTRFHVEKTGFESDVFDRRALRNLIRAGEVTEQDRIRVDDADAVLAGGVPYLKSLFALRKTSRVTPPVCCRTHTDQVAFFQCIDSLRPLCEDCAPSRKFGATTIRVCQHCGGVAKEFTPA